MACFQLDFARFSVVANELCAILRANREGAKFYLQAANGNRYKTLALST